MAGKRALMESGQKTAKKDGGGGNRVRAKVRLEFPEKLFYEAVLYEWRVLIVVDLRKQNVSDVNHASVIKKAHANLKRFPLNVDGYHELRKIKGIGEDIATRLDAAWRYACANHFLSGQRPTLQEVRNLAPGDALRSLTSAHVARGRVRGVPFLRHPKTRGDVGINERREPAASRGSNGGATTMENGERGSEGALDLSCLDQPWNENEDGGSSGEGEDNEIEVMGVVHGSPKILEPVAKRRKGNNCPESGENDWSCDSTAGPSHRSNPMLLPSAELYSAEVSSFSNTQMLCSDPSRFGECRLTLVVDAREHSGAAASRGRWGPRKPVTQQLEKLGLSAEDYELRPLSVGDYLWVLHLEDGRGEMVLDYVVERKTWDDLKASIRGTRYSEQKSRLLECGIRNVVLVAEGTAAKAAADHSLEQALVTTSLDQGFLIHRTTNLQSTAKFLKAVGERLARRCRTERMYGPPFEVLQSEARKTKTISVTNCWLKQMTVCPGMSLDKAQLVGTQCPTFRSMVELYRDARKNGEDEESLFRDKIPQINQALSAQMHKFFAGC